MQHILKMPSISLLPKHIIQISRGVFPHAYMCAKAGLYKVNLQTFKKLANETEDSDQHKQTQGNWQSVQI